MFIDAQIQYKIARKEPIPNASENSNKRVHGELMIKMKTKR